MTFDKKAWAKSYNAERRKTLKANGLCVRCKGDARPDRGLCQACADRHGGSPAYQSTETNRKKWSECRRLLQAQGKCVQCREARGKDGTEWRCCWCAATHRKQARKHTENKIGRSGYRGVHKLSRGSCFVGAFRKWTSRAVASSLEAAILADLYAIECDGANAVTNYPPAAYGLGEWP